MQARTSSTGGDRSVESSGGGGGGAGTGAGAGGAASATAPGKRRRGYWPDFDAARTLARQLLTVTEEAVEDDDAQYDKLTGLDVDRALDNLHLAPEAVMFLHASDRLA